MKPLPVILALALLLATASASLAGWSVKNPYRTYNLTGLNYGAQNWEEQHRGNRGAAQTTRPRFLRRR